MAVRKSSAVWKGKLKDGNGQLELGSGAFEGSYSFASRFEEGSGTNPEELIGAAHAGCFSMALAHGLEEAGFNPESIETTASVKLEPDQGGFGISEILLETKGKVPDIDDEKVFLQQAEAAKNGCPVSKALAGVKIILKAELIN